MACYVPQLDKIRMPDFGRFKTAVDYYATLAHEHVHFTRHPSRLHRDFSGRFADAAYAFEELVAELGAAFLSAELGLSVEPREDQAVYIKSWLQCLKQDARAIFTAASKAQAAVDWMKDVCASAGR
jgi:antirestriction protein ArdC